MVNTFAYSSDKIISCFEWMMPFECLVEVARLAAQTEFILVFLFGINHIPASVGWFSNWWYEASGFTVSVTVTRRFSNFPSNRSEYSSMMVCSFLTLQTSGPNDIKLSRIEYFIPMIDITGLSTIWNSISVPWFYRCVHIEVWRHREFKSHHLRGQKVYLFAFIDLDRVICDFDICEAVIAWVRWLLHQFLLWVVEFEFWIFDWYVAGLVPFKR